MPGAGSENGVSAIVHNLLSVFLTVQNPVKKPFWPLIFTKLLNIYFISFSTEAPVNLSRSFFPEISSIEAEIRNPISWFL